MLLLQAAHAAAAPVHVIVDSVPKSGDWPEWAKILISAATGAVLGVGGSLFMEWMRPRMMRHASRELIKQHINDEFFRNRQKVHTARVILAEAIGAPEKEASARLAMSAMLYQMPSDRHAEFFASEKAIVYDIDPEADLLQFYSIAHGELVTAVNSEKLDLIRFSCENLMVYAGKYSLTNGFPSPEIDESWMEMYHKFLGQVIGPDGSD